MRLSSLVLLLSILCLVSCYRLDDESPSELIEKREALEFNKRLFHPFSTKNEEIKRETREVYEEKCESIIPFQRLANFPI